MNKFSGMGRLTKDPELRRTQNQTAVCGFTLAVNRRFKQEGQPDADFINCTAWTKTAEFVEKYFRKGQMIAITGRIQTRFWDDNEGKRQYMTEVVVEEAFFTESKKGNQENQDTNQTTTNDDDGFVPVEDDDDSELPF